jgi:hypothetical protein
MSGAFRFASATKSKSTLEVAFPKSKLSVPFPVYKLVNGEKGFTGQLSLTEEESFVTGSSFVSKWRQASESSAILNTVHLTRVSLLGHVDSRSGSQKRRV